MRRKDTRNDSPSRLIDWRLRLCLNGTQIDLSLQLSLRWPRLLVNQRLRLRLNDTESQLPLNFPLQMVNQRLGLNWNDTSDDLALYLPLVNRRVSVLGDRSRVQISRSRTPLNWAI